MFYPFFTITDRGFSGNKDRPQEISRDWFINNYHARNNKPYTFNPYTDLQAGGITLGFRGKNHWFSYKTLLGRLLKPLFINNYVTQN